jgi:hypothetical protein
MEVLEENSVVKHHNTVLYNLFLLCLRIPSHNTKFTSFCRLTRSGFLFRLSIMSSRLIQGMFDTTGSRVFYLPARSLGM